MKNLSRSLEDRGPFSVQPFESGSLSKVRALAVWNRRRVRFGLKPARDWCSAPLLTTENHKLAKNELASAGLSLAPAESSGFVNACGWSTPGCRPPHCLASSGHNGHDRNARVRAARTAFLFECPATFWRVVGMELKRLVDKHGSVVFRGNLLSDIRFEFVAPGLADIEGLILMDYTKAPVRVRRRALELGWSLTYSVSERTTQAQLERALVEVPVAVVSRRVPPGAIDGDLSDERYLQSAGDLVVLSPKGSMPVSGGIVRDDLTA